MSTIKEVFRESISNSSQLRLFNSPFYIYLLMEINNLKNNLQGNNRPNKYQYNRLNRTSLHRKSQRKKPKLSLNGSVCLSADGK
jgi:hypothetical protein